MRKRERESEREREKDVEYCSELLFLFLKGMIGALAPFSYIVLSKAQLCIVCKVVMLPSFVNISLVINLYCWWQVNYIMISGGWTTDR